MPNEGKYVYCILEGGISHKFGKIGLEDREVYTISYQDISAVVSNIPFEEMKPVLMI